MKMENKNIFITGATGFIGRHLALSLAGENNVFALIRPESKEKAKELEGKGVKIISGGLLESASYSDILKNMDYVFHLAALFRIEAPKDDLYKHNVSGTEILLEACRGKSIEKIICFSTAYVAGVSEKDFIEENEPYPDRFKNWYEWSKVEAEKKALDFYNKYNLPVVIIRPVIVYGKGSKYGFYDVVSLISKGKLWALPGSGKNNIHLVCVVDVVSAAIYLAQLKQSVGQIYNISGSSVRTCEEVVNFICKAFNVKPPILKVPAFIAKLASKTFLWKLFFKGISGELLDYFLYNQTYSNAKIKLAGYKFKYDDVFEGFKNVLS